MNRVNKKSKKIFILLILFIMFSTIGQATYASSLSGLIGGAEDFITEGQQTQKISSDSLSDLSGPVYNLLLVIGMAIAVIVGLVLGIKFMTGTIEERSKIKESLIPYIAGCVVIFGAFGIWKLVVSLLGSV